jgi:hypothetical protein
MSEGESAVVLLGSEQEVGDEEISMVCGLF